VKGKTINNGETGGMIPYGLEIIGKLHTTTSKLLPFPRLSALPRKYIDKGTLSFIQSSGIKVTFYQTC